jgi:hypothetical protein
MERILNELLQQLRAAGYDASGQIGSKWMLAQNSDQYNVLFQFDNLEWTRPDRQEETHTLRFVCGYPSQLADSEYNIELFEHVKEVLYKFLLYLRQYENASGQQVCVVNSESFQNYQDYSINEITTSGVLVTLGVTLRLTEVC